MAANTTIIFDPVKLEFNESTLSGGFCSFDERKQNPNSFDAITPMPTPGPKETAKQIPINIERMKQMPNNSKEDLRIRE